MRIRIVAVMLALGAHTAVAQMEHDHGAHDAGKIGRVHFPTSCSAQAQPVFERGVALLHSFWFEEAVTTFRHAAQTDTTCAMAWWGLASSYLHPLWSPPTPAELRSGTDAVASARRLNPPTERERAYVEAIGAFYDNAATSPHIVRLRAWESALGRIQTSFPADTEAAIFHAVSLIAIQPKNDTAYAQLRQAAAILEPLFAVKPRHPGLAHYLIHAYDAPPLVARATRAAERYATIAPSVPHALHMPSHTYSLLGQWDKSIATNLRANRASRAYEVAQHMRGASYERMHASDYIEYAYLQQRRNDRALALVREVGAIDSVVPAGNPVAMFALVAIPARYALERGDWRAAAALGGRPGIASPLVRAVTAFARTIGAARSGDSAAARREAAVFPELEAQAARESDPFAPTMIRVNRLAALAWLQLATGDTTGALRMAADAADLEDTALKNPLTPGPLLSARELLGDMQLETGRPADAVATYRAALARTPGRARSLDGLRAAQRRTSQAAN